MKELYPFQRQGVEWLIEQSGGILADDMGLGKTVQVIAAVRLLFNRAQLRSVLIVCPKSLIATWEREFERWAPELGVAVLTPPARIREDAWKVVAGRCHVLLTNYEQLRDPPEILKRTALDLIVADEAHWLRNRSARITSGSFQPALFTKDRKKGYGVPEICSKIMVLVQTAPQIQGARHERDHSAVFAVVQSGGVH